MMRRLHNRARWSRLRRMTLSLVVFWLLILMASELYFRSAHYKYLLGVQPLGGVTQEALPCGSGAEGNCKAPLAARETILKTTQKPLIDSALFREFTEKLRMFEDNLKVVEGLGGNPEQLTKNFTDILESPGPGVPLPYDMNHKEDARHWQACDPRDADFTPERDRLCQAYLSNLNNVRYIKAMSSRLFYGRTIKFRLHYAHNGIKAIVKVSQKKFYFEASSEFLAFSFDRALNFSRIPTSVFVPLPLDYIRVATAYSPLFSQWLDRFLVQYDYTKRNFVPCDYPSDKFPNPSLCSYVTIQLWMLDVHSALSSFLAIPYVYDSAFASRFFVIGHPLWPPRPSRLRAIGDVLDRFIFDFLIDNTDRGMNDHNNFVYGGCSYKTTCRRPPLEKRTKGVAKYAFIDHGSSFYSRREPPGNPFTGDINGIPICRFRKSTYEAMNKFRPVKGEDKPLVSHVHKGLVPSVFRVTSVAVIAKAQERMNKILKIIDRCIDKHGMENVFSLQEYYAIRISEEEREYEDKDRSHASEVG